MTSRTGAFAFAALLVACAVAPASPLASETRTTGAFHAVELDGALEVDIRLGPTTRVEISADADLVKQITTEVRQGTLLIGTPERMHPDHKVKVTITTPTLDGVALRGAGRIAATGIAAPKFAVAVGGAGEVELTGTSDEVAYDLGGTASIHAKDLASKSATVSMGGTGNVAITATDRLTVSLSGVGEIAVYGHPKSVTKSVSGIGHVELR